MTDPVQVIEYIAKNFPIAKGVFDVHSRQICSALAYQFLLRQNGVEKLVGQILADEPYIGLLGESDEFEVFHNIRFLRLHAILHDVFGRVYNKYGFDRGYTYCFDAPLCMKKSPFLGHITGFWFCLHHKLSKGKKL